jgi:hypothetical protein
MSIRQATALWKAQRTRRSDAARPEQPAQVEPPNTIIEQSTPLPARQMKDPWAERNRESKENQRPTANTLGTSTGAVVRSSSVRQKIIGHGFAAASGRVCHGRLFRPEDRHLALPDQPPRQVGCGIFVEPLIEQRRYLLPQIGGMTQTRKLIALQGIARSREKEFPRRLGARSGQDGLRSDELSININDCTSISLVMTSNAAVTSLWKGVENSQGSRNACSACAGDYEDPDRTSWLDIDEEVDEDEDQPDSKEQ